MIKNHKLLLTGKNLIITTFLLLLALITSYYNFQQYKPKAIKQVEVVKGIESDYIDEVPIIDGAEKASVNKTDTSTQTTFNSKKSKDEIQEYYRNIFLASKWDLESQGIYEDFVATKYKKDNQQISVITYDMNDDYKTLVSLEISKL